MDTAVVLKGKVKRLNLRIQHRAQIFPVKFPSKSQSTSNPVSREKSS